MTTPSDPFAAAQQFVLSVEGGFSNNPKDPGGVTNLGVTIAAWAAWKGRQVTIDEMRALTPALVAPFYKATYWRPINGDKLPPAVALLVYQAAVNMGVYRAAKLFQTSINADPDGDIGPQTCVALRTKVSVIGLPAVVKNYCDVLREYYQTLPTFSTFGKGWFNRVSLASAAALKLV